MKIALVAPFEESVPPKKYGGTEMVVANLATELHHRGHDVTLFATGDSLVPCKLVAIFPEAIRTQGRFATDTKMREMAKYVGISRVIKELRFGGFDIVHNHIGWRFTIFSHLLPMPIVTTLHGPPGEPYQKFIHEEFPQVEQYISISDNQRKSFPELPYISTVYNGIELEHYPMKEEVDGDYFLFLARFSPEKGAKEAIEIAKRVGKRLVIATKIDTADKAYFESCKKLIETSDVEFVGEIGMDTKIRLLQNATALLAPIQWEEPFGLFIVEAMACGTPAVAWNRGSFPEIISHGVDGYLGNSVEELAYYADMVTSISKDACRKKVEDMFSKEHMTDGYLTAYEKILRGVSVSTERLTHAE